MPQVLPVTILLNHCSLRLPKKPRAGHEFAFRLNINSGPMTGKLIIDPVRLRRHLSAIVGSFESQSEAFSRRNRGAARQLLSGLRLYATPRIITASMVRHRCPSHHLCQHI